MRVTSLTADPRYMQTCAGSLYNASFGNAANFFGPNRDQTHSYFFSDQWNDDILWFGMPALSGAEMYGITQPKQNQKNTVDYIKLSKNTFDDVWKSWDPTTCNGGIFWIAKDSPVKSGADKNYKSTITNVQFLSFAARMYGLTNDQSYLNKADMVYLWLQNIGLVRMNGDVYDGASAPACTSFNTNQIALSYIYGQLIEGLSYLYQVTKKETYLKDAELYANKSLSYYSRDNVIRDTCEPRCDTKTVPPKGILLRGYAALYPLTTHTIQAQIKTQLQASMEGMLKTCDDKFNCNSNWGTDGTIQTDVHKQINTVELFAAALKVFAPRDTPVQFKYDSINKINSGTSTSSSSLPWPFLSSTMLFGIFVQMLMF